MNKIKTHEVSRLKQYADNIVRNSVYGSLRTGPHWKEYDEWVHKKKAEERNSKIDNLLK